MKIGLKSVSKKNYKNIKGGKSHQIKKGIIVLINLAISVI